MSGASPTGYGATRVWTVGGQIVILGGGGTAVDFAEAAQAAGNEVLGFLKAGGGAETLPVLGSMADWSKFPKGVLFFCGFGSTKSYRTRLEVLNRLGIPAGRFATLVHPQAAVSPSATLAAGSGVLAFASIGARVRLGAHVEILQSCIIGHDSLVEDGAILAGGVNLASDVRIGRGAFIGAGACVRNAVVVGEGALVGMNSTVLHDVPSGAVVVGSPAQPLAERVKSQ